MTDFKVGDRVRGNSWLDRRESGWHEGTYEGPDHPHWSDISIITLSDGRQKRVFTETLEAVKPEAPAVGSKVRVTYEGVVTQAWGYGFRVLTDNGKAVYVGSAHRTVEVLEEPKPERFKLGTVALNKDDSWCLPVIRGFEGQWHGFNGEIARRLTDELVRTGNFEILYAPSDSDS